MKHIITFIFAVVLSIGTLTAQYKEITLDEYLYGYYFPRTVRGIVSMNDGESYTVLSSNKVIKYSYKTGEVLDTVVDFSHIDMPTMIEGYTMSDDGSKILFYSNESSLYRHSFFADYKVYDIASKRTIPLLASTQQRMATLSPDGSKVAYIVGNNIYVIDLNSNVNTPIQITTNGAINRILNGVPDWVYEEEFGIDRAYEFSPDGKYLAYVKFDENEVRSYTLQYYDTDFSDRYNANDVYPYNYEYKYPKVGEANSTVSVHIYEFSTGKTTTADLGSETDIYVPKLQWTTQDGVLAISRLNRLQNRLDLLAYDVKTGTTKTFFTMQEPQYIEEDVVKSVHYMKDGKSFLIQSEQNGYRNIYRYGMDGKLINAVTSGDKEVIELFGCDSDEKKVYFTAVGDNTTQVAVYSVDINGKNRRKLSTQNGTNSPQFSKSFKYYLNFFSNAQTPRIVTVCDNTGKTIRTVLDNNSLAERLKSYGGINKRFFEWRNKSGDRLNAYMIVPPDFDSTRKYPVLVVGYNGPNSNEVNDEFEFDWHNLLAQKGVIVACTDTRGTGRKGENFRKCTYGQLGNFETQDLADFNKYLASQNYIDGSRIGIWGWSYGGFMTLSLLTRAPGLYKLGVAIAPVTNWEYYDNIYTERYMGLPQQNNKGYKDNAPLKYAENLQGKLLLAFGSADDNVHPQNSMIFAEALVQADKDFEMMQFTNKNHGIYGGNTTRYLYGKFIRFILENL
ncbi:MAG: S9 family peptidase [Bacteroidales bacterium]|nr:S9 family peptidase [Bacteroidales bacterium]